MKTLKTLSAVRSIGLVQNPVENNRLTITPLSGYRLGMKTNLTEKQVKRVAQIGETGGSVTLAVIRALPKATEADLDREINRVYDSMEYPEASV